MDNSEFGENLDFFALTDIVPLDNNGTTSDTYKVRISGKWHFLKRPKQEFTNHPQYNAAFEKEFDIGYTLDHPNIVRYISKGKDNNGFYFLTEYVDGQTLKDFISNNPTYFKKKEHVQKFIEQLLSAISYLHQKQILHLDLKPENILITNIGYDVKIIDLGFAYSDCYQFLTTGKTNLYAAPEQLSNGKIDQRADIYGIGMILLYVLTQTTDRKQLNKIPKPYKSIISKCLNDNIEDRYFDISALNKNIVQSSKKKPAKYLLLLFILMGIGLFFFIKPYLVKETEIPTETIVPIDTTPIDTIKEDFQEKKNEDKKNIPNIEIQNHQEQNLSKTLNEVDSVFEALKPRVQKEVKGYFDQIYSKYSSVEYISKNGYIEAAYNRAVSDSYMIANTLHSENPQVPINTFQALIKPEVNKNTTTYWKWLLKFRGIYLDENSNKINLNSIKETVQLAVKQQYNKLYSIELSPMVFLNYNSYNAIDSTYKVITDNCRYISLSLPEMYPQFSLDELRPTKYWIIDEIESNKTIYDNWLKEYCKVHKEDIISFAKEKEIAKSAWVSRFKEEL